MEKLVVVDGSNIATEGRAMPSLRQLHEAVMAFREEHPDVLITVVVDATFGHRIEPAEIPEFDAAVEHNELVTPPAGAVGRGDAFVLTIANKANATILSNDSFQEFHGYYPWLFDEGRLIGGKPVPHVGWVFVSRTPVRGPTSRKAVRTARQPPTAPAKAAKQKKAPEPVAADAETPLPPPAGSPLPSPDGKSRRRARAAPAAVDGHAPHRAERTDAPTPGRQQMVNELLPFLAFVEEHPVGTAVEGVTDSYSSHGAYVVVGDTRCYVPLRHLGHPAPRSAREVLRLGTPATFTVVSFNPARRSIDLALAGFAPPGLEPAATVAPTRRSRKKAAAGEQVPAHPAGEAPAPAAKRTRKKAAAAGANAPVTTGDGAASTPPAPAKQAAKRGAKAPAKSSGKTPAKSATKSSAKAPAKSARSGSTRTGPSRETEPAPSRPATRTRKQAAVPAASTAEPVPAPARRGRKKAAAPDPLPEQPAAKPAGRRAKPTAR
jgi:hypothetical protein